MSIGRSTASMRAFGREVNVVRVQSKMTPVTWMLKGAVPRWYVSQPFKYSTLSTRPNLCRLSRELCESIATSNSPAFSSPSTWGVASLLILQDPRPCRRKISGKSSVETNSCVSRRETQVRKDFTRGDHDVLTCMLISRNRGQLACPRSWR